MMIITLLEKCSQNGHIQLVGIGFHKEVQICVNNSWHWINGDIIWNDKHASIICRTLDFSPYGIYMIINFLFKMYIIFILNLHRCNSL